MGERGKGGGGRGLTPPPLRPRHSLLWRLRPPLGPPPPTQCLDVRERDGASEVVLLDAGVATLGGCGGGGGPRGVPAVPPGDVHADHVPEVPLEGPAVVVVVVVAGRGPRGRRVGHGLGLHHGHGDGAVLLGAAAVRHGAVGEERRGSTWRPGSQDGLNCIGAASRSLDSSLRILCIEYFKVPRLCEFGVRIWTDSILFNTVPSRTYRERREESCLSCRRSNSNPY